MIDREKVVTWLTICGENSDCSECCPYHAEHRTENSVECMSALMRDALELLKEHPQVIRCKDCKWYQAGIDIDGKPFTRCNGDVRVYGHTTPDWFCAYGDVMQDG